MEFSFGPSAGKTMAELAEYFNIGFSGYFDPVDFNPESFADYVRAYQVDAARSMLAYGPGGEFGGFNALGMRGQRGWVGGFGVAPAFRGSGIARQFMLASIEQAKKSKLTSLLLEVLIQNEKAYQLYLKTGYKVTRETVIFGASDLAVREATPIEPLVEVTELEPGLGLARWGMPEQNRDFPPCWQRETASILGQRGAKARQGRLRTGEEMLLIYLPVASRRKVALLHAGFKATTSSEAQAALGGGLLTGIVDSFGPPAAELPAASFSILNEPDGSPLALLLHSLGFSEAWREYEMLLEF